MKISSAIAFILIGISLLLQQKYSFKKHYIYSAIGKLIGIYITLFGLISSIELLFEYNFNLDQYIPSILAFDTGKPAPITTLTFFLIGLSLLLINVKNTLYLNQLFSAVVGLIGLLIVTGYFFSFHSQSTIILFTDASLYTAFCFILISLSLLFMHPSLGIMSLFISNTNGGAVSSINSHLSLYPHHSWHLRILELLQYIF